MAAAPDPAAAAAVAAAAPPPIAPPTSAPTPPPPPPQATPPPPAAAVKPVAPHRAPPTKTLTSPAAANKSLLVSANRAAMRALSATSSRSPILIDHPPTAATGYVRRPASVAAPNNPFSPPGRTQPHVIHVDPVAAAPVPVRPQNSQPQNPQQQNAQPQPQQAPQKQTQQETQTQQLKRQQMQVQQAAQKQMQPQARPQTQQLKRQTQQVRPQVPQFGSPRTAAGPRAVTGPRTSTARAVPKVASFPILSPTPEFNGSKDRQSRDDNVVVVRNRKVRLLDEESGSIYANCRSWLRNGLPHDCQPNFLGDGVKLLPRPFPALVDSNPAERSEDDNEAEDLEKEEHGTPSEELSTEDLLAGLIKRSKRVRAQFKKQRDRRIARYNQRLSLLLPGVDMVRNDAAPGI